MRHLLLITILLTITSGCKFLKSKSTSKKIIGSDNRITLEYNNGLIGQVRNSESFCTGFTIGADKTITPAYCLHDFNADCGTSGFQILRNNTAIVIQEDI